MSYCQLKYESPPFDFQISDSSYYSFFANRDPRHFSILINNFHYHFSQISDQNNKIDMNVTCNNSNEEGINDNSESTNGNLKNECELLKRLFLKKKIPITVDNREFLQEVAQTLDFPDLLQATKKEKFNFIEVKKSPMSFLLHTLNTLFGFVCKLGIFDRIIVSFWDIAGPMMIVCVFLNILILFVTMALVSLKDYMAAFVFVVIPFLLYSLYFPNIVCVSLVEALERNIFRKKTFFYSHQKLISAFARIVMKKKDFPKYFNFGKWHDFIHGIVFIIFIGGFIGTAFASDGKTFFLDIWLQAFVFYIPVIRYLSLFILYIIHSIASLFNSPRKRYLKLRNFSDPYLATFYLRPRCWVDVIFCSKRNVKSILLMIFSKTTFSILIALAVIIYMIATEVQMKAYQIIIAVFIFIICILTLATRITFPFFWLRKITMKKLTESQLEEMRDKVYSSEEIFQYHINSLTWGKKYTYLRYSSLIMYIVNIIFIIVLIPVGIVAASETSNQRSNNSNFESMSNSNYYKNYAQNISNKYTKQNSKNIKVDSSLLFGETTTPACFMEVKGLSLLEIIALSQITNINSARNGHYDLLIRSFLPNRKLEIVDTPFIHDTSFLSSMTLIRLENPKLSVFTIRGTVNAQDIIADAEIWFASVMLNIVIPFLPLVELYSDRTLELIGIFTNVPRYAFNQFSLVEEYETRFKNYIDQYINALKQNESNDEDILITGHSLGGGLSKILSLATGVQAVAISGPGIRSIGSFYSNESLRHVKYSIIDVIPGEDLIARVDIPIGTQVEIPCRNGLSCHDAHRILCQISTMCGIEDQTREWCERYFDNWTLNNMKELGSPIKIL